MHLFQGLLVSLIERFLRHRRTEIVAYLEIVLAVCPHVELLFESRVWPGSLTLFEGIRKLSHTQFHRVPCGHVSRMLERSLQTLKRLVRSEPEPAVVSLASL